MFQNPEENRPKAAALSVVSVCLLSVCLCAHAGRTPPSRNHGWKEVKPSPNLQISDQIMGWT